jgi:hypothetical protein
MAEAIHYMKKLSAEGYIPEHEVGTLASHLAVDCWSVVISPPKLYGRARTSPVFFSQNAFEKFPVETHFLSNLFDHEALHATDLMNGIQIDSVIINFENIDIISGPLFRRLTEARAYSNQLAKLDRSNPRNQYFGKYLDWCLDAEKFAVRDMYGIIPRNSLEQTLIDHILGL